MFETKQVRNNLRVVLPSQQNRGGPEEAVVVSFADMLFKLDNKRIGVLH